MRGLLWRQLDPGARARGLSPVNIALTVAIVASVAAACLETEPTIASGCEGAFDALEVFFTALFLTEFAARLWLAPLGRPAEAPWRARLRWLASPAAMLDLLALAPALVWTGMTPAYLFRLVRILRIAKLGRFSRAWSLIADAVASRRYELLLTLFVGLVVMLGSATLMYLIEGQAQPDKFGSIPRALWWAVVTLTTIGYGDVYPVTPIGKLLAGVTAVLGIGLIAAPTRILAAAFSDAVQRHRAPSAASSTDSASPGA